MRLIEARPARAVDTAVAPSLVDRLTGWFILTQIENDQLEKQIRDYRERASDGKPSGKP